MLSKYLPLLFLFAWIRYSKEKVLICKQYQENKDGKKFNLDVVAFEWYELVSELAANFLSLRSFIWMKQTH